MRLQNLGISAKDALLAASRALFPKIGTCGVLWNVVKSVVKVLLLYPNFAQDRL